MKKLQSRLFIGFFSVSLLVMLILTLTSYHYIKRQVTEELCSAHLEVVSHTATSIDSMTNMLLFALSDGPFQRQFKSVLNEDMDKNPYEALQFQKSVAEMFTNYSDTYQNLQVNYYVTLYGFNGFHYCSMDHFNFDDFRNDNFFQEVLEADGKVVWDIPRPDPYLPTSSKIIYTMARAVKTGKNYSASGILAVMIEEDSLYRIYRSSNHTKNNCFIIDESGQILSSQNKNDIGKFWPLPLSLIDRKDNTVQTVVSLDGQDTICSFQRLSSSDWWLVDTAPSDIILLSTKRFLSAMSFAVFFCLCFSTALSYFLSRQLCHPIHELNRGMLEISHGNLSFRLADSPILEFHHLIIGFHHMAAEIQTLIEEVRRKESAKKSAEIRFLQAQINPHFIYNTLNSIRCMILMGENNTAATAMVRVIQLIRNVLSASKRFVTLDEELRNLENYIDIEKAIYYNHLEWDIKLSPNVHTALVPNLLLQPLVENSIFHGIVPGHIDGKIEIAGWQKDSILHLTVRDNGVLDPEKRKELTRNLQTISVDYSDQKQHIGLSNVSQRIKFIYGNTYGIELLSDDSSHTTFHLWFPFYTDPAFLSDIFSIK